VVDYIFWHKWFEFAVFNFADIMINLGVAIILLQTLIQKKAK
ncbi:MAG: signal peptidase II, partial [Campylobacter sp.]|nr:signal peptidase II [Campylobacter sp.]